MGFELTFQLAAKVYMAYDSDRRLGFIGAILDHTLDIHDR